MPAFNASSTISSAIHSVLQQTYDCLELIIVDDCSIDETVEIAQTFTSDPRVSILRAKQNGGPAVARNIGLDHAHGQFIAFLDADDVWLKEKLRLQVQAMIDTGVRASCSWYRRFRNQSPLSLVKCPRLIDHSLMLRANWVGSPTGIVEKDLAQRVRFKDIGHEDYEFWLRVSAAAGVILGIPERLAFYRLGRGTVSANKMRSVRYGWQVFRTHCKGTDPRRLFGFFLYTASGFMKVAKDTIWRATAKRGPLSALAEERRLIRALEAVSNRVR